MVVSQASNVNGAVQDLTGIREAFPGSALLVDAAQTAGLVPIDVASMNIDVVCFTGHKSLFGPSGTGGMYISEHVDINPCRAGGTGVMSALKSQPEDYPWRMEFGTVNSMGVAGLLAAQRWISGRGGVGSIYEHEMRHARRLRDGLAAIDGVRLYCADLEHEHLPVFVFNIDGLPADQAGTFLDVEHDIITRTGLHCAPQVHEGIGTFDEHGTVRFSPGVFTTDDEVERAIEAVAAVAEYGRTKVGARQVAATTS